MAITVTAIIPKKMNIKAIRQELTKELESEGKDLEKDYSKTSSTWNGDAPKYPPKTTSNNTELSLTVMPDGTQKAIDKWKWLNFGTSVRYATMSGNWQSKTKPGRLQSGAGRGQVVRISRMHPRPGIKARKWNTIIFDRSFPRFRKRMKNAIRNGTNKLY